MSGQLPRKKGPNGDDPARPLATPSPQVLIRGLRPNDPRILSLSKLSETPSCPNLLKDVFAELEARSWRWTRCRWSHRCVPSQVVMGIVWMVSFSTTMRGAVAYSRGPQAVG